MCLTKQEAFVVKLPHARKKNPKSILTDNVSPVVEEHVVNNEAGIEEFQMYDQYLIT